jgi:dipeptidyl aminopeptidase/acylaminoacyl peptidase
MIPVAGAVVSAHQQRTLTPDDLFNLERIGDVTVSPDGQMVAFVWQRPRISAREYQQRLLGGNDHADVWLVPVGEGQPMNLTQGEVDSSGYWMPIWSPDSTRLAMLSNKGGDNVRLWVWERGTGSLTKLSDRGVATWAVTPFLWVDNRRLATALLPEGEQPIEMTIERRAATVAMQEWPKNWAGRETTANVLESGVPADLDFRSHEQLTLLDVTGKAKPIMSTVLGNDQRGRDMRIAPDRQHIAFQRQIGLLRPNPAKLLQHGNDRLGLGGQRYQIAISDASGSIVMAAAKSVRFVVPGSFRWSNDGRCFAFIGVRERDEDGSLGVFQGSIGGAIDAVSFPDLEPKNIVWADGERLLVSAERDLSNAGERKKRTDWWLVSPKGAARNLTGTLKTAPDNLLLVGSTLVGVADGDVWSLEIVSEKWTNLTAAFDPKISAVIWPNEDRSSAVGADRMIVSFSRTRTTEYGILDFTSGGIATIVSPSEEAKLAAYSSATGAAVFSAVNRMGTFLTIMRGEQRRTIVQTNAFLREVAEGQRRILNYQTLDGKEAKGWLVLPLNYQSGKRYPLVTWVYAGTVYGDKEPSFSLLNYSDALWTMQLFAARGYAVLLPSMPLKPEPDGKENKGSDPYMELTKGVLPAVDKAIELGIADPTRLAVAGHSFGGFSTYGLVTQSDRFKAAVSLAGSSDLISLYASFIAVDRYEPYAQERALLQSTSETGQLRMGNPPWKDWARYLRNSPLFYVDRVQTPLLIVQGDMDYVAMQQGEEFFAALYRQNKRARFVRYWGEGHVLDSPANIRDFWMQVYAWLDEFCDITRDASGNLDFDGDHVKSRNGAPPLKASDFAQFNEVELHSHPWVKSGSVGSKR